VGGVLIRIGAAIEGYYGAVWRPATIESIGASLGTVRVAWHDATKTDLLVAKVRQTCIVATRRRTLLKFPRVLAIIGSERQRRACAIRLMAICETICPGLWSSARTETLSEVRDGALEYVSDLRADAVPLELSEAET